MRQLVWIPAVAGLLLMAPAWSQEKPKLDAAARTRAIRGVLQRLTEGYVVPEVALKMEQHIREREAQKSYDSIEDGEQLARVLTRDLRSVSNDKHIRVGYSPQVLPPEPDRSEGEREAPESVRKQMARDNFGLTKLDILRGNIGYLQFRYLAPPELAGDTYVAAMNYLANTEALILDLRTCGGAMSEHAIPMLCSYFFATPVHLNDIYWRSTNSTRQSWTWAHVPGKRYLNKPIYVLTSRATFSGAEELAYDLQNLKRATLIGDITGGGANPGWDRRADDHFTVWVPNGRAINPITKTNWEGVGVKPDVPVAAARALHVAHTTALKKRIEETQEPGWREMLKRALADTERSAPRYKKVTFSLKGFPDAEQVTVAGSFNGWDPAANPLTRQGETWVVEVEAEPGRHTYKFVVDGRWITDPDNAETERDGEYVNSVRKVE